MLALPMLRKNQPSGGMHMRTNRQSVIPLLAILIDIPARYSCGKRPPRYMLWLGPAPRHSRRDRGSRYAHHSCRCLRGDLGLPSMPAAAAREHLQRKRQAVVACAADQGPVSCACALGAFGLLPSTQMTRRIHPNNELRRRGELMAVQVNRRSRTSAQNIYEKPPCCKP